MDDRTRPTVKPASLVMACALALTSISCGHDCLALPCALPVAIIVDVTEAATGAAVKAAVIHVSGAVRADIPCNTTCRVPGTSGTYDLEVTAAGFEATRRTVRVQGTTPPCGCPTVVTENLSVALVGSPPRTP
jgi:hypothetical protein